MTSRPRVLADIDPAALMDAIGPIRDDVSEIASSAMRVISIWSLVDGQITGLMADLLSAEFVPVCDMLSDLRSARMPAIRAVAKHKLPIPTRKLFNRCLDAIDDARRATRDMYAHHIWATSDKLPVGCIMLVAHREFVRPQAVSQEIHRLLDEAATRDVEYKVGAIEKIFEFPTPLLNPHPSAGKIVYPDDVEHDIETSIQAFGVVPQLGCFLRNREGAPTRTQLSSQLEALRSRVQACCRRWT